ncbi:hypothetical protein ACOSP7_014562 [Xanthoceras sorbifolium]
MVTVHAYTVLFTGMNLFLRSAGSGVASAAWSAPPESVLKLNCGAAVSPSSNRSGLGFLVRDHQGNVLHYVASGFRTAYSPLVAEALSVHCGIRLALEAGFFHLQIETDAQVLVNTLNSRVVPLSEVGFVVEAILKLLKDNHLLMISFVPRLANGAADVLVKFGLSLDEEIIWIEDYPSCVNVLVKEDAPLAL